MLPTVHHPGQMTKPGNWFVQSTLYWMLIGVYFCKVCNIFIRFDATVSFNVMAGLNGQCVKFFTESSKRTIEKTSEMLFCRTRIILSI